MILQKWEFQFNQKSESEKFISNIKLFILNYLKLIFFSAIFFQILWIPYSYFEMENHSVESEDTHQSALGTSAAILVDNLDPKVDEKLLDEKFSVFGVLLHKPKIQCDSETGNSEGFAFVKYASFEASDAAIEAMDGQYLCNKAISVSYILAITNLDPEVDEKLLADTFSLFGFLHK